MQNESGWYLGKAYTPWDAATRAPAYTLPPGACDCAVHVYDPSGQSRLDPRRKYDAPPFTGIDDMRRMHAILGVQRAVLVQPSIYGTDHRLLLQLLRAYPDAYRGVAIVDDSVSDAELAELHAAGVRSARFNVLSSLGTPWSPHDFQRNLDRIRELDWIVSLPATVPELAALADFVRRIRQPVVLDHLAYFSASDVDSPGERLIAELVAQGNWWLKISRTDQVSTQGPPYDDTVPLVQRLARLDISRVLWATDWPHVLYEGAMPNDGDLVDILARHLPDAAQRRAVLVDNPAELFGFAPVPAA